MSTEEELSREKIGEEDASQQPYPSHEEIGLIREIVFVSLIIGTQLLTQSTLAQTAITDPVLAAHFGVSGKPGEQSWFAAAVSLTVGTFILIAGRLGDMFGYKKLFVIAYCFLFVFSLITGFTAYTRSVVFFDVMRGLQGLALSLAFPNAVAIFGHYYPVGMKRIICMCLFGAVAPGGFIISCLFGSWITVSGWWPWTFWVLSIVALGVAILSYFIIPLNIVNHHNTEQSFDIWGSILGVSGLVLINFAFNQGPNVGWDKVYVYVLFIVSILAVVAFFFVERRVKDPLIPKEVMKGETGFVLACIAAGWSSFGIWLFYTARFGGEVEGLSIMQITVRYIPPLPMGFVAAGLTAVLLPRVNVSWVMTGAMLGFLIANILMGTRPAGQIYWGQWFVSKLVAPFGMDMSFPAATVILSYSFPKHQQGIAASLVSTVVNYSISIGLGFAGLVELYTTRGMPEGTATTEHGIRNAFRMAMGLAGLGVLVSILFIVYDSVKHHNVSKETDQSQQNEEGTINDV